MPGQRLAELFNVNHFIVSQVNPHINPLMNLYEPLGKVVNFVGTEACGDQSTCWTSSLHSSQIEHRMHQLMDIGLLPKYVRQCV